MSPSAPVPRRLLLLAPLAAGACSNPLSQPFPDKRIFGLEVPRPGSAPPSPRAPALLLRETAATAATELRGLVRRLPGNRQEVDFWNEFAAPPARLVDAQLRAWLAASGAFSAVLDPGSAARGEIALEPTLTVLRADLSDPQRPVAEAALALLVLDLRRERPRPVLQETRARSTPLSGSGAAEIVAGLAQALGGIFAEVEQSLRRLA